MNCPYCDREDNGLPVTGPVAELTHAEVDDVYLNCGSTYYNFAFELLRRARAKHLAASIPFHPV